MSSRLLTVEHSSQTARVLVVTNMWPHTDDPRYGIFVKRQVDSLIDGGLACTVLFIRGYRSPLAYAVAALRLLALNWRGRRYALVHSHGGETALAARLYVRAPVITSYCGTDLLGTAKDDGTIPIRNRAKRWTLRQHARLLTATVTKTKEMDALLPRPVRSRNSVIPNGVDRELFAPLDRGEARRKLGWADHERIALFAADPTIDCKRFWLAREACDLVAERLDSVRLHVAASVPPKQIPMLMSASDCLLLTSSHEGSPNVVKEALACNLPVISTPVGDVPKLLDGVQPSWISSETPESIARHLIECLSEPKRSNGREALGSLWLEPIAKRLLDLYNDLAPGSAPANRTKPPVGD